jgi:hypothetical protein
LRAHVYVYYRVAEANHDAAAAAVRQILDDVVAGSGVSGRCMRREDDPDTWMEVYEAVGDTAAFCTRLAALSAASGLDALLGGEGRRHVERFVELTPCA